jgi:hypothetical protein
LEGTHTTLQKLGYRLEELFEETSQVSSTSISVENQIYPSTTFLEGVGGLVEEHYLMEEHEEYPGLLMGMGRYDQETLEDVQVPQGPPFMRGSEPVGHTHTPGDSRARGNYEDTSILVIGVFDIHGDVDPVVHLGYKMVQED